MLGAVERWPNQVIHGRIDNREPLVPVLLLVEDTREQHAGRRNNGAPWLQEKMRPRLHLFERLENGISVALGEILEVHGLVAVVRDAEASAGVDKFVLMPVSRKLLRQISD